MDTFTRHLRSLLIIALVLSPVQPLFAMETGQQADHSMAHSMDAMVTMTGASHAGQSDALKMSEADCNKQGKCNNCQGANHCNHCPLSPGIPQVISKCTGLNAQVQLAVSDVSLHRTDLSPDYRPPRYS